MIKKFVIQAGLISLLCIACCSALEMAYTRLPCDYAYKRTLLDKKIINLKTLIVGSSMLYRGIDPRYLKEKSFNASFIGQSLKYDLVLIKKYFPQADSLRNLIICVSYPDFRNSTENLMQSRVVYYTKYFDYPSSHHFFISEKRGFDMMDELASYYLWKKNSVDCDSNGFKSSRDSAIADLENHGITTARFQTKISKENVEENINCLNEIVKLCRAKKIRLYIITPPLYQSFLLHVDAAQMEEVLSVCTALNKPEEKMYYFNFLDDHDFIAKDFLNSDHLNADGAKKLTLKMDSILSLSQ